MNSLGEGSMNTILMFGKDNDIPDMGGVSKKSELFGGGVHEYNSHVWKISLL